MLEQLTSINPQVLKVVGMVVSGLMGLIMSVISKRSVNYRKIDKSVLISSILFFVYLNGISIVIVFIGGICIVLFELESFLQLSIASAVMAIITVVLLWGVLFRTRRIKTMMEKMRMLSRRLFLLINWISFISTVLAFVFLPFALLEQHAWLVQSINIIGWVSSIWWFYLMIVFVWRTANYIYSEMRITLLDGEVIHHSCSPKMCRIHRNYIRLITRGEGQTIIGERHINEVAIKQIEYL
ncbi:MAG: hypothetical protein FWD05_12395 [Oscillospiraceae bacterium]|nr:hypothetical protein [Oscillospiraceae bacterium]